MKNCEKWKMLSGCVAVEYDSAGNMRLKKTYGEILHPLEEEKNKRRTIILPLDERLVILPKYIHLLVSALLKTATSTDVPSMVLHASRNMDMHVTGTDAYKKEIITTRTDITNSKKHKTTNAIMIIPTTM